MIVVMVWALADNDLMVLKMMTMVRVKWLIWCKGWFARAAWARPCSSDWISDHVRIKEWFARATWARPRISDWIDDHVRIKRWSTRPDRARPCISDWISDRVRIAKKNVDCRVWHDLDFAVRGKNLTWQVCEEWPYGVIWMWWFKSCC